MTLVGTRTANMNPNFEIIEQEGDYILSIIDRGCNNYEYVTHFYNKEDGGSYYGVYSNSYEEARMNLLNRAYSQAHFN